MTEIKAHVTNLTFRFSLKLVDESVAYLYVNNQCIPVTDRIAIPGPKWSVHILTSPIKPDLEDDPGPECEFKTINLADTLVEADGLPLYYQDSTFPSLTGDFAFLHLRATRLTFGLDPAFDNILTLEFSPGNTAVAMAIHIKDGTEMGEMLKARAKDRVEREFLMSIPTVSGVQ
jgi:hypothetical protein